MKNYLRLLRPKHYVKNVLVLLPLFFSGRFFERMPLCVGLLGFAAFCLLSSLVYIVNDLRDAPADRLHPTKCRRPIASGAVGVSSALALAAALGAAVLLLGILARFPAGSWLCMGVYLLVNLGYSFGLKNVPILDVALLVSGFLLRVLFGASVTGITISNWLYLTVVSISFYLALGKRRGELRRQLSDARGRVLLALERGRSQRRHSPCLDSAARSLPVPEILSHGRGQLGRRSRRGHLRRQGPARADRAFCRRDDDAALWGIARWREEKISRAASR